MELPGFPYFEVELTKSGDIHDQRQVEAVADFVADGAVTDLFVMSHGWNNDMDEARELYRNFFTGVGRVLDSGAVPGAAGRGYAVLGILWPSKKFTDTEVIPGGGAASIDGGGIDEGELIAQLDNLKGVFDPPDADATIEEAKALVPKLEDSPKARREFAALIRKLFPAPGDLEETIPERFFSDPGDILIDRLGTPLDVEHHTAPAGSGAATSIGDVDLSAPPQGSAAGIGGIFNKIRAGVQNLLNFTTYYQMKERAGIVGKGGANGMLRTLRERHPALKIHMIGHSFGGRLVTAATDGPDGQASVTPSSVTLLQAAFSHNGFSGNYDDAGTAGFFRKVVTGHKVAGALLISHSSFDKAVGVAYPLASRIVGDSASAIIGGPGDKFGGIGRNGAQKTVEATDGTLLPVGGSYTFRTGGIYNLRADDYIKGHSDICKLEVAYALLTAVAAT